MYRLSLALGYAHPRYLLAQLTSAELSEWMAYYSIEPFGQDRQDYGHAMTAASIKNAFRIKGAWVNPIDLMPRFERPEKKAVAAKQKQTTGDMQKMFRLAKSRWGKRTV